MFDLFRSRDKAVRYLLGGLLGLVALSMVITLIPGFGSNMGKTNAEDQATLAEVGGTKITTRDVQLQIGRILRSGQLPAEMVEVYIPQFIESNIQQHAAVYEAERMGLRVSDDEVLTGLMTNYPNFFPNGVLASKEQFVQALQQQGRTLDEEVEAMRSQLLVKKLDNVSLAGIVVTPKEIETELLRKYEKATVSYIAFPTLKFRGEVKVTDEDLQSYFLTHRNSFVEPEKRAFHVLVADQAKVEAAMQVTEAQLRAAYSSSMDSFRTPERAHVRHILVGTTNKSDAEKKQLLAKAEDLLKKVRAGGDFTQLAKDNSEDPGSKDKGGEYWVVRGQMVKPFEDASFNLKPGESSVVTTDYGYHVMQVIGRENARVKPFEEVKESLATELKRQGVADRMQAVMDQARAELVKNPSAASEIGKKFLLEIVTVTKASPGDAIPMLGVSPEIDQVLATLQPNQVSQALVLPSNRMAVVVLDSRTPARPSELHEAKDKVRDAFQAMKSELVASDRAKEVAEKLKAGGDMEKLAKSMKLEVVSPPEFGHTDAIEGLGTASYVEDAFTKPIGTILGPIKIQGREVVVKVLGQTRADLSRLTAERDQMVDKIRNQKAQARYELLRDSILSKLTAEGKVKINREAIKRFTASYRTGK